MTKPVLATKLLKKIDSMIKADQGAAFRQLLEPLIPKMEDAYRGGGSPYRSHLGVSLIGRECARDLWYGFRWAKKPTFPGRILRLFNRGHLEEARFIALLQMVGCQVWYETEDGGQFRLSDFGGHFGSSLDGVVRGVPDLPEDATAYAEFKTSSDSMFKKVKKTGLQDAKPEHFTQMQICMRKFDLLYGLYVVVNKNDDTLYAEIIELDTNHADSFIERGRSIIFTDEAPLRINTSPTWFKCKMCDKKDICHGTAKPDINCRTCAHSTPLLDGTWACARGNANILVKDETYIGCPDHIYNPNMLNGVSILSGDREANYVELQLKNGTAVMHGPAFVTSELLCLD
jgi:hypothetical protein